MDDLLTSAIREAETKRLARIEGGLGMSPIEVSAFPCGGIVPKQETGALRFVSERPECDGRGIIVGILDTGVDPGASGLQCVPDGSPKVIDLVDCSGSGDVDTSTIAKTASADAAEPCDNGVVKIQGLSGRVLRLNPKWMNPSGEYRVGIKCAYELWPKPLITRVQEERKKSFDAAQRLLTAEIRATLSKLEPVDKNSTPEQKKAREDAEALLEHVAETSKNYADPGPVLDCVVFHDGQCWRAAVDVEEKGDLMTTPAMTDYRREKQFASFGAMSMLNYGVNIEDEGNILSIVCDAGAHGTHVAGIVAAYHPDQLDMNGVAPGAQIVGLKISDSRLGSMETGASICRAMIAAVRAGCNVINMSFGEPSSSHNYGRIIRQATELVNDKGIIFVSSAGNNGPALTTVGAPGGTSSAIIGVGAFVSPAMMLAEYSMRTTEPSEGSTYTWSSVGPTDDGEWGVDIIAPGGAITCVPNWTLQKKQLMNGTSMSSPNACGCIALLLSALKQQGIPCTPHRVRRAVCNTAKKMEHLGDLVQGHGMVQVEKALQYLVAFKNQPSEDIRFDVHVENRPKKPRGVYLRQPSEVQSRQSCSIFVKPNFHDDVNLKTQQDRVNFEMFVSLQASDPSWVFTPDHLVLLQCGRSFTIEVDPTKLPVGVHTASVKGFDSSTPERGAMFEVPITVVRTSPQALDIDLGVLSFEPAQIRRHFFDVPAGASWMDVCLKDLRGPEDASSRHIVLHTVQLLPHTSYHDGEKNFYLHLLPGQVAVKSIPVQAGVTVEMVLARYWSAVGETCLTASVHFQGVRPVPDTVIVNYGCGAKVRLASDLRDESILPKPTLDKCKTPLRPKSALVAPLKGDRDMWFACRRIYELVLTYEFTQADSGSCIPMAPALNNLLYESAFEQQFYMVYDSNKKLLGVGDCFPKSHKVPKGTITVRMQVRHDDAELLDNLKDMTLFIIRELKTKLTLDCWHNHEDMVTQKDKFKKLTLRTGTSTVVFVGEPAYDKLPTMVKPGDILEGSITYESRDSNLNGSSTRPGGFPMEYVVPPKPTKSTTKSSTETPDERDEEQKLFDAVRTFKVEHLGKLSTEAPAKFNPVYAIVLKEYPDHLPLRQVLLKHRDHSNHRSDNIMGVVDTANDVISLIDQTELACYFGTKHDTDDPAQAKTQKDMKAKKEALVDALGRKARALADLSRSGDGDENLKAADAAIKELKKWVAIHSTDDFAVVHLEELRMHNKYGTALKKLNKLLTSDADDTKSAICHLTKCDLWDQRKAIYRQLGPSWRHLVEYEDQSLLVNKPKSYGLF